MLGCVRCAQGVCHCEKLVVKVLVSKLFISEIAVISTSSNPSLKIEVTQFLVYMYVGIKARCASYVKPFLVGKHSTATCRVVDSFIPFL